MRLAVFLCILLFTSSFGNESQRLLIFWNVGQGSWTTLIEENTCTHIDAGGETNVIDAVTPFCQQKHSRFILSHWDWDHYSFLNRLIGRFPNTCAAALPQTALSYRSKRYAMKSCTEKNSVDAFFQPTGLLKKNESSVVVSVDGQVLIPGDSTKKMERRWINELKEPEKVKTLVLGHHGSNTSTSVTLLKKLPGLKQAIVSARRRRYGHPHPKVVARLRRFHIPLISTEDWGHVGVELEKP